MTTNKKRLTSGGIYFLAFLIAGAGAATLGGSKKTKNNKRHNKIGKVVNVSGTVSKVNKRTSKKNNNVMVSVIIKSNGKVYRAVLAPEQYLSSNDMVLQEGDEISVVGTTSEKQKGKLSTKKRPGANKNKMSLILVQKITKGSNELAIRGPKNKPLWL
ncbi:MAG: hypothetical protein ABUK01_06130 [Leptospirales bacterium]